jgi:hypothetical protein
MHPYKFSLLIATPLLRATPANKLCRPPMLQIALQHITNLPAYISIPPANKAGASLLYSAGTVPMQQHHHPFQSQTIKLARHVRRADLAAPAKAVNSPRPDVEATMHCLVAEKPQNPAKVTCKQSAAASLVKVTPANGMCNCTTPAAC